MDEGKFLISWTKYDAKRNDPKAFGGAKFKITTFDKLEPTDEYRRCRAQMWESTQRIVTKNIDWKLWNNATYVDVDGKFWYTDEQKIKDNPPEFVYAIVYNWMVKNYQYNISDVEMSRSKLGFHFYFYWSCERNEYNRAYYNKVAFAIVKKAFIECGYKDIIEYPKVLDDCTDSYYQLVYPTKINWIHNHYCNGKIMTYDDLDIDKISIEKKKSKETKRKLENILGVSLSPAKGKYEFVLVNRFDVDKVDYIEHRGPGSRWTLFDSLRFIFHDKEELKEEWIKCCRKIPECHGHSVEFYINEPYKQNQEYNWVNKEYEYCDIDLLRKFGYEVKPVKINNDYSNLFKGLSI